jgi:hypothetical protein
VWGQRNVLPSQNVMQHFSTFCHCIHLFLFIRIYSSPQRIFQTEEFTKNQKKQKYFEPIDILYVWDILK